MTADSTAVRRHVYHNAMPYHTMPCHAMPCHAIPYHTIPYHTIPYHTIPCHAGPAFKMASVPARDQLGRGIAQKATLSLKRKAAARAGTPLPAGLPTGKRRAPGTPLPISAAGKRLASNLRGGTPSSDAQLRASYKPLPSGDLFNQLPWLCFEYLSLA